MAHLAALSVLLLVCLSGGMSAPHHPNATIIISKRMGCFGATNVSACIHRKFSKILERGKKVAITSAQSNLGGQGTDPIHGITFPKMKIGLVTISGSGISVSGLNTLNVTGTRLSKYSLATSLVLPRLRISGDFRVTMFPLIYQTVTLELNLSGLVASAKVYFNGRSKRLAIKDVRVTMKVKSFRLKFKKTNIIENLVNIWMNNNKTLNEKTLPWLSGFLKRWLKKTLNKHAAKL